MAGRYTVMEHPKLKGKHRRQLVTTEQFDLIWVYSDWKVVKQSDDPAALQDELAPAPPVEVEELTAPPPPG